MFYQKKISTPVIHVCVRACLGAHITPDSKVHGANIGPIWGRQDPGGPHVGPINFVIWDSFDNRLKMELVTCMVIEKMIDTEKCIEV